MWLLVKCPFYDSALHASALLMQEVIKSIQNVLQTNVSVATSLGQPFAAQFNVVFGDMLQVFMSP
jgi:exportin-1